MATCKVRRHCRGATATVSVRSLDGEEKDACLACALVLIGEGWYSTGIAGASRPAPRQTCRKINWGNWAVVLFVAAVVVLVIASFGNGNHMPRNLDQFVWGLTEAWCRFTGWIVSGLHVPNLDLGGGHKLYDLLICSYA